MSGCTFTEISRGLGKGFPVTDKARGLPTPVHRLKISDRICSSGKNVIIFPAQTVELRGHVSCPNHLIDSDQISCEVVYTNNSVVNLIFVHIGLL